MKAQKWVTAKRFQGLPKREDFELVEEELPPLKDGEALFQAEWLSVDPYMRYYTESKPLGTIMTGEQVARVVESRNPSFVVGDHYRCHVGWRNLTIMDGKPEEKDWIAMPSGEAHKIYPPGDLPTSVGIGVLGMPGATAYIGLVNAGRVKAGDVVYVNGAAGATGSIVGQIAKIKGCTVIGSAGSEAKCKWLKDVLGFDHVFNYRELKDIGKYFSEVAPNGIDIFYENVGGAMSHVLIANHMANNGRVIVVGQIAHYNSTDNVPNAPDLLMPVKMKRLQVLGFNVLEYDFTYWDAGFDEMSQWIREGKMKFEEHITEGFDKMPEAFAGVLRGDNTGKAIVKA